MLGEDAVLANGDLSIPSVAAIDVGESFNGVLDAPPVLDLGDEDTTEDPRERIYSRVELLDVLGGVVVVGSFSSSCTSFKISFTTFIMTESFNGVLDAPSVLDLGDEDTTEDPRLSLIHI